MNKLTLLITYTVFYKETPGKNVSVFLLFHMSLVKHSGHYIHYIFLNVLLLKQRIAC